MSKPEAVQTVLRVDRAGSRRYVGSSSRGASVEIGSADVEGVFTPGELLKIALAACSAMASDRPLARRLGEEYQAVVHVSGEADRENEVYPHLAERLELDLSSFDADAAERIIELVRRSVDAACTVGRTVQQGSTVTLEVVNALNVTALDSASDNTVLNNDTVTTTHGS